MQANSDRLSALRGSAATAATTTVYMPKQQSRQSNPWAKATTCHDPAVTAYRLAQEAAKAADAERLKKLAAERDAQAAHWAAVNASFAAAQSKQKPIMATYCCCICITQFERDVTDDPDGGRPSPLGDTCDACRAAGKQRPFEAAGMTIVSVMVPKCRFCQGDHWAMNCPNK